MEGVSSLKVPSWTPSEEHIGLQFGKGEEFQSNPTSFTIGFRGQSNFHSIATKKN